MAIVFNCGRCLKRYDVSESLAGRRARCTQCGEVMTIPFAPSRPAGAFDSYGAHDPYGLADPEPYAMQSSTAGSTEHDGERFSPEGPAPKRKPKAKSKKRRKLQVFTLAWLSPGVYQAYLAAIIVVALTAVVGRAEVRLIATLIGIVVCSAPFLITVTHAFYGPSYRESLGTGLMYTFVPFYRWYYWSINRKKLYEHTVPGLTRRDVPPLLFMPASTVLFFIGIVEMDAADMAQRRAQAPPVALHAPVQPAVPPKPAPLWPDPPQPPRLQADPAPAPAPALKLLPPRADDRPRMKRPERPRPPVPEDRQVARAPAPPAPSAFDQRERLASDVLAQINRSSDQLARIFDLASAQDAALQIRESSRQFAALATRAQRLPHLSRQDDARLNDRYREPLRGALERYADEVARVRSIPGVSAVLPRDVLALQPFVPGFNIRITLREPVAERPVAPRPRRAPEDPDTTVTVNVAGAVDAASRARVHHGISQVMSSLAPECRITSNDSNGKTTYTVTPVDDPQAFADKVTFGKVTRVAGRVIDVVVAPSAAAPGGRGAAPGVGSTALAGLKSPDPQKRRETLRRLAWQQGLGRDGAIARAVRPLLKDPDGFTRADAVRALGSCGGPDDVPALLELLDAPPGFGVRLALFETLKRLKDSRSAGPVAAFLSTQDRYLAVPLLKALGPDAELAVLPYLDREDAATRAAAANVLKDIGGPASLDALRRIAGGEPGPDTAAARFALDALSNRGANPKTESP